MISDLNGGNQVYNPGAFHNIQVQMLQQQRENPNIQFPRDMASRQKAYQEEMEKKAVQENMAALMVGGAQGMAGRGIPAYNKHEANGRQGLVDPSLTGQETMLPSPIDRRMEQAANLMGIMQALPPHLGQINEQIVNSAVGTVPQMQRALKQPYTIYELVPQSFITNRMNIALQRNRENSLYAVV